MEHIEILKNRDIPKSYISGIEQYNDIQDLWESTNNHQYLLLSIIDSYSLFDSKVHWLNLLHKLLINSYTNIFSYDFNKSNNSILSNKIELLIENIGINLNNDDDLDISNNLIVYINSIEDLSDKFEKMFIENLVDFLHYGEFTNFKIMVEIIAWIGSRYITFESMWDYFLKDFDETSDINLSWNNLIPIRNEIWDSKRDTIWESISANQCDIIRSMVSNPFYGNALK
jgi:hypothetical protein